ncbi:MAG: glycosyltransferase family 4 protein [Polaromonas sp.]|nr:glycosyltransferase family 4 protein [Polaromonas sp.]
MNEDCHQQVKILHITQTALGGVGSYLEELLALQVERYGAACVRVVLPKEHAEYFPGLPIECLLPYSSDEKGRLGSSLRMAARAIRSVRQWQPDIVHLHATFAGFVMRPLLALLPHPPKIIYCAHGWSFERRKVNGLVTYSMAAAERYLSRLCSAVVCVSLFEASRAQAIGIPRFKLKVVASGLADITRPPSTAAEALWPKGRIRVLFVGRLDHEKGVDVLLSAMKILGDKAYAIIVGAAVVTGYKSALDQPDNVKYLGWLDREKIRPLYATADMLVIPSHYEAFGLSAVEAMRAGLPVIASRVGGLPEVVVDFVTGRMVEPGNPDQLAAAIASMGKALRREMGANARERFLAAFRIERTVEELHQVYENALQPPRPTDMPINSAR